MVCVIPWSLEPEGRKFEYELGEEVTFVYTLKCNAECIGQKVSAQIRWRFISPSGEFLDEGEKTVEWLCTEANRFLTVLFRYKLNQIGQYALQVSMRDPTAVGGWRTFTSRVTVKPRPEDIGELHIESVKVWIDDRLKRDSQSLRRVFAEVTARRSGGRGELPVGIRVIFDTSRPLRSRTGKTFTLRPNESKIFQFEYRAFLDNNIKECYNYRVELIYNDGSMWVKADEILDAVCKEVPPSPPEKPPAPPEEMPPEEVEEKPNLAAATMLALGLAGLMAVLTKK